jgi:uroporphyrinogen III methyltransferase/synthase
MSGRGRVILVGAGPGAPDLITVRGERALRSADAVVYDALAPEALLDLAPPEAERINVGKRGHDAPTRSQEEVNALLVGLARQGKRVVRLKGGDPFVFGRGGEEASACRAAGVPFEVVPGVSSAIGALAYAGIPVTDRRHSASFAVVTGHKDPTRVREEIRWDALASGVDTLVVLMGMRNLEEIVGRLLAGGRAGTTPAAVVMLGTTPRQRVVEAPLRELPKRVAEAALGAPAALVVGDVVRLRGELAFFEALPLFGRRVLVTRRREQAGPWVRALQEAGAEAVVVPMIRIEPMGAGPEVAAALRDLATYDRLVLTSANAVAALAERAAAAGRSLAALRARVHCVGPATAEAARAVGLAPEPGTGGSSDAEGLLEALRAAGGLRGQRVLLPGAAEGRPVLAEGLRAAGARVDALALYRTCRGDFDAEALRAEVMQGAYDALTFASPSAARHFAEALGPEGLAAARRAVVVAIGRVTAEALAEQGLPADVRAPRPGADDLVAALAEHFAAVPGRGSS